MLGKRSNNCQYVAAPTPGRRVNSMSSSIELSIFSSVIGLQPLRIPFIKVTNAYPLLSLCFEHFGGPSAFFTPKVQIKTPAFAGVFICMTTTYGLRTLSFTEMPRSASNIKPKLTFSKVRKIIKTPARSSGKVTLSLLT